MDIKKIRPYLQIIIFTVLLLVISVNYSEKGMEEATNIPDNGADFEVHFIDVGQGDSIFIMDNEYDIALLIDGGDRNYGTDVVNFIKSQGVNKLDYVVATHPHADHIGGLISVFESFPVENVVMPEITHTSKTYENFINSILENEGETGVIYAKDGLYAEVGNLKAQILAPFNNTEDLNNNSVVLRLDYKENSFLFTGDIEKSVEKEILNQGYNVNVDVLKVPHHGSRTSNSEEFIAAVSPYISVIQLGKDNDYNHPHEEAMEVIEAYSELVYRNDEHGTISLYFNEEGYALNTEK